MVDFSDVKFGLGQPLQSIRHIRRPYTPRSAITQLHDVALVVLCDPHRHLPRFEGPGW